jgi:hypothetical protein
MFYLSLQNTRRALTSCLLLAIPLTAQANVQIPNQTPQSTNQDLTSPEAIVNAFFASGSGPAGPRDFVRMRSLFAPGARVITIRRSQTDPATPNSRSIDEYIEGSREYLATNGNFERVKKTWVEQYANLAHVFCSFEARKSSTEEVSYRGVGSFQLLWDGARWWILSAYWQGERPNEPLPSRYRDAG